MAELKRPPGTRKGFYVRMRLLKQPRHTQKNFCFCHYKWVIWISLSLYFLSSYLISHGGHGHNKLSPKGKASRSLFESIPNRNSTLLKIPQESIDETLRDLKVYIYDLPSRYNSDWLSDARCSSHLFAAEVALHRALLSSDRRTFNPSDADFFFVPVYVSCNFSTANGFPAIGHARSLLSSAIELVTSEHPFWNRSRGSDHFFVASHDYGACFHAMEDRAIADGVPQFLKNSIVLQTFGVNYTHPCQDVENVVIPPYIPPETVNRILAKSPAAVTGRRDILVFFRGKMEVHPKTISGRFYSKAVRSVIWHKFNGDRRFYLRRQRFPGYQSEIVRSVFCLCPLGWAPWSPRLVESVALGCVPVIIADGIRLPFPDAVPWPDISLTVAEKDAGKLDSILEHVAATNLSTIQRNLWIPDVRRALLFHDRVQSGDATWQVLSALAKKLDRSLRRVRVSSQ